MNSEPLFFFFLVLDEMLRSGKLSSVSLTEFFLNRLETIGPLYNAVVTVSREKSLVQARRSDEELAAGYDRGPLHGIPYGAKDILATSGGIPTSWGVACYRNRVFDYDATVIKNLERAGAVLAAKLAMVELAGGMGYRQPYAACTGPGINPWDISTWSGGSSSGSGSAVCGGLVPFAVGSETWGSIVTPANNCGVSGLRPSYGTVSREGSMVISWTLDKLGPLALTAQDCGLVLEGMLSKSDENNNQATIVSKYRNNKIDKQSLRIAVPRGIADSSEPAVRENFQQALEIIRSFAKVEEVDLPDYPYPEIARIILLAEASSAFEDFVEEGELGGLTAPESRCGPFARIVITARDYLRALRVRTVAARHIGKFIEQWDAVVAPTRDTTATPLSEPIPSIIGGVAKDIVGAIGCIMGFPTVSVPSGFSEKNLPTGIQFMGKANGEGIILSAACQYQALTSWHLKHPEDPNPELYSSNTS